MNDAYVVMNRASGKGPDSQWFDFSSGGYAPPIRVEWDLDTMHIVVPENIATSLIRNGHARSMTSQEREEYALSSEKTDPPTKETKP